MRWVAVLCAGLFACGSQAGAASSDAGSPDGATDSGGGTGPESGADTASPDAATGDPFITYDSLAAAYEALQGGATDVSVSVEGREHYVRVVGTSGDETDTLVLDGNVIYRAIHTTTTTHVEQDQNGDGTIDWSNDVVLGATDDDRQAVILSDPAGTGSPSRTTMTQTAATPDSIHVKVEAMFGGAWITETEIDTPVVQGVDAPVLVDSVSCDPLSPTIQSGMEQAITQGIAQMQHYGVHDVVNGITALMAERGVRVVCNPDVYNLRKDCAEASIFDSLTHSRMSGLFGSRVTVNVAPLSDCVQPFAFFHELLHIVTGLWHKPPISPSDKEWKADDRVYSCTDVAFEADNKTKPTTMCECATCLKTSMNDPRCSAFDKCPADIVIESATCTSSGSCPCAGVTPGNIDVVEVAGFTHGPTHAVAAIPNLTGDAKIDCGGWGLVPGSVLGDANGCVRDPDAHSRMEWSSKGSLQLGCQCNPAGIPQPLSVTITDGDPKFPTTLAYDTKTVSCP